MFSSSKDQIMAYLAGTFSQEMRDEIAASFMVMDAFSYQDLEDDLIDILNDFEADDDDLTQAKILETVNKHLTKLLQCHQVALFEEASIAIKNQILSVLFRLQKLEDPTPVLRLLETQLSNEEKLAKIVEMYSEATETEVLENLEEVGDGLLSNLMTFLYEVEERLGTDEVVFENQEMKQLKTTLRDFFTVNGNDNLAFDMIYNGIEPGLSIKIYYPYIQENIIVADDLTTAKNLLSLFLMSADTCQDPLSIYHKYSEQLIHDPDRIVKIEVKLGELLNKLRQYQEAQDVARSVSFLVH